MISSSQYHNTTSLDQLFHILFDLLRHEQNGLTMTTTSNGITVKNNNDSSEIISSCNENFSSSSSSSQQPSPIPHAPAVGQQPKRMLSFGKKVAVVGLSGIQNETNTNNNFEKDEKSSAANNNVVSSVVGSYAGSANSEIYNQQQPRNSSSVVYPYNYGHNSQQPQSITQTKTSTLNNANNSPQHEIQYLLNAFMGALKRKHAQFNTMIQKKKSLMFMIGGSNNDGTAVKNSILEEEDFYICRQDEISAVQHKFSHNNHASVNEEKRNSAMLSRFKSLKNEVLGINSENDEEARKTTTTIAIGDERVRVPQKNFRHLVSSCLQFRQTTATLIQFLILDELPLANDNNNNNNNNNNNAFVDDVPSFQQILLRLTWNEMIALTMKQQNDGSDKFGETNRRRQREAEDQFEQQTPTMSPNEGGISWCKFFNSLFFDGFLAVAESQTKSTKSDDEIKRIQQNYITANDRRKFLEKLLSLGIINNKNNNNNSGKLNSAPDAQQQHVARILAQYLFHVGGKCQSCAHREEMQDSTITTVQASSVLSTILGFLGSNKHRSVILSAFSNLVRDNLSNDSNARSIVPTIFSSSFLQILRSKAKLESLGSLSSSSSVSSSDFFNESSLLQFFATETKAEDAHNHSHSKIISTLIQAHREKVRLVAANSIFKSIQNEIIEDPIQFFGTSVNSISISSHQISCRQFSVFNIESGRNAYQSVNGSLDFASSLLRWLVDIAKTEMTKMVNENKNRQDGSNRGAKTLHDDEDEQVDCDTSSMLLLILPLICLYLPVTPLSDEENFLRQCARLSSTSFVPKKTSSQTSNTNNISNQTSLIVEESEKLLEMVENDSNHDDAFYFPEKHKLQKQQQQQQANKNNKTLLPKSNDDLTNLYLFSLALGLELFLELQHRSFINNNNSNNNNNIFSPKSSSQTVGRNQQKEDIVIRFILRLRTIFHFQTSATPVMTSGSSSSSSSTATNVFSSLMNDMGENVQMNSSLLSSSSSSLLRNSASATVNTTNPTSCLDFIHVLNSSLMLEYHQHHHHHHVSLTTPTNNINNANNNLNEFQSNSNNNNNSSHNSSTWWDILLISLSAESLLTHAILSEQGISGLNSEDTSSSPFLESFEGRHFLQEFFGKFCKTFLDLNLRFSQNSNNNNNNNMKNYRSGSGLSLGMSHNSVFSNHHRFHSSFGSSSSSSSSFSRSFSADHNINSNPKHASNINATATSNDEDDGVLVSEQEKEAETEELDAKLNYYASLLEDQEQIIFGLSKILKWGRGAILSLGRGCSTMNRGTSDFNQDRSFYEQATGEKQEGIISHLESFVLQQHGLFVRKLFPAKNSNDNNHHLQSENLSSSPSSTTKFLLLAFLLKEILCPNVNDKNSLQKSFDNQQQQQQQNLQLRTSVRTTINSLFGNSADRLGKRIINVASMFEEKNVNGNEQDTHEDDDDALNFVRNVCKYLAPKLSSEIVAELREKVKMNV